MWYGPFRQVLNEDAHLRVVAEASVLSIKSEVRRMQVNYEGGRSAFELLQDMTLFRN